jgi:biopolymer transport protein ExbD
VKEMDRFFFVLFVIVAAGCELHPPRPVVLQETELRNRVVVEHAEPVDPESVLFTIHEDGRVTWRGQVQTREDMAARAASTSSKPNRTPILFDVDPKAGFHVVRDALTVLTGKPGCVNYSFLVATPRGLGVVVLPMQTAKGLAFHFFEGRSEEKVIGSSQSEKYLELIVSPGKGGEIDVNAVNFTIPSCEPEVYFPEAGEKPDRIRKPPDISWLGQHPPCGRWTLEMLRSFLSRKDVATLRPYILFTITNKEPVGDVVRCLSALRSFSGIAILPDIPVKD